VIFPLWSRLFFFIFIFSFFIIFHFSRHQLIEKASLDPSAHDPSVGPLQNEDAQSQDYMYPIDRDSVPPEAGIGFAKNP
jgi:hypothetical protein